MRDMGRTPTDADGHRARLRTRLLDDPSGLQDYELIEYLLATAIPRRDTKSIAKALLREFGSIARVLTASPPALMRVAGVGETAAASIKVAQACAIALHVEQAVSGTLLDNWDALIAYLRADMAWLGVERLRVLYLNSKNALIRDELMSEGSVDQTAVYIREVIKRGIELGATALILVHNHPSGDPEPSRADITMTREIADAGRRLGIAVHDHVIIGAKGEISLKSAGLF